MTGRPIKLVTIATAVATALAGCGDKSSGPESPPYDPQIPTAWASAVTNPYFRLVPGTTAEFEGSGAAGVERVVVEVLTDPRTVKGVVATTVRDRVYLDGDLIEDTLDWYAQDDAGNVWYLGEDSKEIAGGVVVGTEGSWEWGVNDALPGIQMWANPEDHLGEEYRQEFYEGEAEDWAKIVGVGKSIDVAYGSFTGCIQIEEWPGLDPASREYKYFASDIGLALETALDGGDRVELIRRAP